jgi:hypothetical protein
MKALHLYETVMSYGENNFEITFKLDATITNPGALNIFNLPEMWKETTWVVDKLPPLGSLEFRKYFQTEHRVDEMVRNMEASSYETGRFVNDLAGRLHYASEKSLTEFINMSTPPSEETVDPSSILVESDSLYDDYLEDVGTSATSDVTEHPGITKED